MGRLREEELRRWRVNEMWSSADGTFTRWGVNEMGNSADGKFTRWRVQEMGIVGSSGTSV